MLKLEDRIRKYEPLFGQWYLGKKIERLGKGNSGTVFAIHKDQYDSAHKRVIATLNYALKVVPIPKNDEELNELRKKCRSEEEVRKYLKAEKELAQREIDIMERLWGAKSNNIVFFENNHIREREDTYGWDVLICMERLERLDKLLENYKTYKLEKPGYDLYMRIWSELLDGLRACESQDIVHLDIKPENIFYGPPGLNRFKLGDFGVSAKTETGGLAEVGMRVGTIEYMAPEVHKGAGGDTRSDLYSLALVIYQLLNGNRLPFQSMGVVTREDSMRASQIRIEGNTPIPRINGVDPATMAVLLKCLEPDPRNRYQTVSECKQALMQVVGGKRKHGKLLPALIAAGAVAMAGLVAVLGFGLSGSGVKDGATGVAPSVIRLPGGEIPGMVNGQQMNLRQNFPLIKGRASALTNAYIYSGDSMVEGDEVTVLMNNEVFDKFTVGPGGVWTYTVDKTRLPEGACTFRFEYAYGSVTAQPFIFDSAISQPEIWNGLYEGSSVVSGVAEPDSIVSISGTSLESINSGKVSSCIVDENGWFTLNVSGMKLKAGERLLLQCSDYSGNTATPVSCVVAAAPGRHGIAITEASAGGKAGDSLRITGTAEPRSQIVLTSAGGERYVDVDPSGNFTVDIVMADVPAETGDIVLFRYPDSSAADCRLRLTVDNSSVAVISHIPASNDPVMHVVAEPGSRCAFTVSGGGHVECIAGEDGIAVADFSEYGITGASVITVLVIDPHGNQYKSAVQANVSAMKSNTINRSEDLADPDATDTAGETEDEAAEETDESAAQTQPITPVPSVATDPGPTAEPIAREPLNLTYSYSNPDNYSIAEGWATGDFRIVIEGEPGAEVVVRTRCSFLEEQDEQTVTLDLLGRYSIPYSYASEGRVTAHAGYADEEGVVQEITFMIDGKAPDIFVAEVTEGEQMLTGIADADSDIKLTTQGVELSTSAGADGAFMLPVHDYIAGQTYTITATDMFGNSSKTTFRPLEKLLTYDSALDAPISSIKQSGYNEGSSMITVTVSGSSTSGREIAVFVNGAHHISVTVGSDGKWSAALMMPSTAEEYDIKAMYLD